MSNYFLEWRDKIVATQKANGESPRPKSQPELFGDPLKHFLAWEQGFDAAAAGFSYESGPTHNMARIAWQAGWKACRRVDELAQELRSEEHFLKPNFAVIRNFTTRVLS